MTLRTVKLISTLSCIFFLSLSSVQAATISKPPYLLTLNSGLVGHWTFDGAHITNGRINDISGQGNNGTVSNIATSTFYTTGKIGQGVKFNGTNSLITTQYQLSNSQPFTVSFWYKPGSKQSTNTVFTQDTSGNDDIGVQYTVGSGFSYENETDAHSSDSITAFGSASYNGWVHVVIVESYQADIDSNSYYINGALTTSGVLSEAATNPANTTLVLGNRGAANIGADGTLDDFRIYNRALTATEVLQLYNFGASKLAITKTPTGLESGLIGHWTFDGSNITNGRINDISGQGNHGNAINIATSTFYSAGKIGQGGMFDGVNDRVATPLQIPTTGAFAVSAWIKGRPTGNASPFIQDHNGTTDLGILYVPSGNHFSYKNEANTTDSQGGWNYTLDNNWHHIVLVEPYSGGDVDNASFYIDGVLITSLNGGTNFSPGVQNMQIGARNDSSFPWSGMIDDFRVYNRTLTATDVIDLYNSGSAKFGVSPVEKLKDGLVGYWNFDGKNMAGGAARDVSGQDYNGTLIGIATSTFYTAGKIGQALKFDGVNDYIRVSATPVTAYPFTFSAWIKMPPGAPSGAIISTQNGGSTVPYYRILHFDGVAALGVRPDSGAEVYATGTTDLRDNTWHHIVGVATSATSRDIYVDGVFVDNDSANRAFNPVTNVSIGVTARSAPVTYLNASVDDVRIYNRALSASEVLQLYNMGI